MINKNILILVAVICINPLPLRSNFEQMPVPEIELIEWRDIIKIGAVVSGLVVTALMAKRLIVYPHPKHVVRGSFRVSTIDNNTNLNTPVLPVPPAPPVPLQAGVVPVVTTDAISPVVTEGFLDRQSFNHNSYVVSNSNTSSVAQPMLNDFSVPSKTQTWNSQQLTNVVSPHTRSLSARGSIGRVTPNT